MVDTKLGRMMERLGAGKEVYTETESRRKAEVCMRWVWKKWELRGLGTKVV